MAEHSKGKLIAELKQSDLCNEKCRCSLGVKGGKILFHTTFENPEANALHLKACWNAFEEGGLVDALLAACEAALEFIGQSNKTDWENEITPVLEQAIANAEK